MSNELSVIYQLKLSPAVIMMVCERVAPFTLARRTLRLDAPLVKLCVTEQLGTHPIQSVAYLSQWNQLSQHHNENLRTRWKYLAFLRVSILLNRLMQPVREFDSSPSMLIMNSYEQSFDVVHTDHGTRFLNSFFCAETCRNEAFLKHRTET